MSGSATRSRELWRGPRTAVLAVGLLFGGLELGLRAAGYGNPRLVEPHASRGWRLEPGQLVRGPRGSEERINARGYREREWPASPAPGPRVVVLGDSVPYGVGVEAQKSWPRLLERGLGPGAEVFCLATPGYTLEQMLAAWREDGRELEPRVVIVELEPRSIRPTRPLREPRSYPLSSLVRRSALLDWLRRVALARPAARERAAERALLVDPDDPLNEDLWRAAEAGLEGLRAELATRGTRLVIVAGPRLECALDPARELDRISAWAAGREDVSWVGSAVALRAAQAPFVAALAPGGLSPEEIVNRWDGPEAMEAGDGASACFLVGDARHLSERGHEVLAEEVRVALEPLLR